MLWILFSLVCVKYIFYYRISAEIKCNPYQSSFIIFLKRGYKIWKIFLSCLMYICLSSCSVSVLYDNDFMAHKFMYYWNTSPLQIMVNN